MKALFEAVKATKAKEQQEKALTFFQQRKQAERNGSIKMRHSNEMLGQDDANSKRIKTQTFTYQASKIVGNGTFGLVYKATVTETGEVVAIKKVHQDKKFKNRELETMRALDHPNIILLKHAFFTKEEKKEDGSTPGGMFVNIVMDYLPETVYRVQRHYAKLDQKMPPLLIKMYAYQVLRGIGYMHAKGYAHRDVKPQNLLVDPSCHIIKICDFGSAKKLDGSEPSVSYICSRYYRAPELIFGNTNYNTQIDVWSIGCVIAELMTGAPVFKGDKPHAQLVEIIKRLGTPSEEDIKAMNPDYKEFKFPSIKAMPFKNIFGDKADPQLVDLLQQIFVYDPSKRIKPFHALAHPYFDELRKEVVRLPNGNCIPDLFDFLPEEVSFAGEELIKQLVPVWYCNISQDQENQE